MFKNYIKIAFRNAFRQKGYTFINVFGMAVGLACSILILLFANYEFSYDRFYENADRICRVVQRQPGNVFLDTDYYAVTPAPLASALTRDYPEITEATTIRDHSALLGFGSQHYREEGLWADEHFLGVFEIPLTRGDPATALADPGSIVLTRSLARKILGDQDPIGQTLLYRDKDSFTVTGVIPDVPANSSFSYTFITSIHSQPEYAQNLAENQWTHNWWYTFLVLADGTTATDLQPKLQPLVNTHLYADGGDVVEEARTQYLIQPLTDIHLGRQYNSDMVSSGNVTYVYLLLAVAFIILLLACVNYMNLAISRSIKRAREVGMRKVIGAQRRQLISQFLGESLLVALLALVLAMFLVDMLLPVFGHLVERPLRMDYFFANGFFLPGLLALVVFVGVLAGSYPAILIASLRPAQVLKGKIIESMSSSRVKHLLIIGQYAISIALVIGSIVVYRQMQYIRQKDPGYDREHVVAVRVNDKTLRDNYQLIREKWSQDPHIVATTYSFNLPTDIKSRAEIRGWEGSSEDDNLSVYINNFGYDFLDVFGIRLVAGRSFEREMSTDVETAALINETAARALGWTPQEAVGKHFMARNEEKTIVGVLKDFHMHSMHMRIKPLIVLHAPDYIGYISARVTPDNLPETIAFMERTVKQASFYPFEYQFLDDNFEQLYKTDRRLGETLDFFTIMALFTASLGLIGLVSLAAEQRTKEIGIRKVLGASVPKVVGLLSKDFVRLVLIANLIAWPVAWYAMHRWLQNFAYRVDLGWWTFVSAGGIALLIAILTTGFQAIRSAIANPVEALRHE